MLKKFITTLNKITYNLKEQYILHCICWAITLTTIIIVLLALFFSIMIIPYVINIIQSCSLNIISEIYEPFAITYRYTLPFEIPVAIILFLIIILKTDSFKTKNEILLKNKYYDIYFKLSILGLLTYLLSLFSLFTK